MTRLGDNTHSTDITKGRQLFAALAVIVESIAATSEKCVMNTFEDHALCLTHYLNGETDSRTCGYMKALNDIELWLTHNAHYPRNGGSNGNIE